MSNNIRGYVPGGADVTQWIFENEDIPWTEEMMAPLRTMVEAEVQWNREHFQGDDMHNWWRFSIARINNQLRAFYARRRSWGFLIQGQDGIDWQGIHHNGIEELIAEMNRYNCTSGYLCKKFYERE